MSAEIIPFDFEEQAVRVVMRDEDPWFVAADVCRVLEIANPTDAVKRLDDDEFTLDTIEGSHRPTNLINESGLYALVLTSRKDQAKRFRKWITAEVLPAIRRTGRYDGAPVSRPETGEVAGVPIREAELWLQMVREARLTRGTRAAVTIWDRSPLPPLAPSRAPADPEDAQKCLAHLLDMTSHHIAEAKDGLPQGELALTALGLRIKPDGLFVANPTHPGPAQLFGGTKWAGGAYRSALLSLPGVFASPAVYTLGSVSSRGIVLPFSLTGEGAP